MARDRRVDRTRRLLTDALVSLILERGYERLTVQEILDRADVGRSTFYAHYRDKESLLLAGFEELRAELEAGLAGREPAAAQADPSSVALVLFAHADRHRPVYRALCGREGGRIVLRHLHLVLAGALRAELAPRLVAAGSGLPVEVAVQCCASAAVGLLSWWVEEDFPLAASALADAHRRLIGPGLLAEAGVPG